MSYDPGFDATVGALPLNIPQAPTGRHKLQRSKLKLSQLELMGDDVDLTKFYASFNGGGVDLIGAVIDASVERTVQGASQLTVTVTDQNFNLLNSGLLSDQLTVEVDGLYWMLVTIGINNHIIDLTFQEREVVIARRHNKPIKQSLKTSRARVTRAQFALRLLREIKELPPIPYVIPALKVPQPIGTKAGWLAHHQERTHQKGLAIPKQNNLTVKGAHITPEQLQNANIILTVGASMVLPRKYLVAAIMCGIQESSLINLRAGKPGDYNFLGPSVSGNPVGVFQQIKNAGWPASRDVAKDARGFFQRLGKVYAIHPEFSIAEAVYSTQNPGGGRKAVQAYARWQPESERIVDYFGVVPGGQGSAADANNTYNAGQSDVQYEFYRGRPPTSSYQKKHGDPKWGKENTWDCWQRLAAEVQWRCFFVSGTFYFISEDDLFKQHPIVTIDADLDGIETINGNYDSQGSASSVTITCRMGRWAAPPGSVVQLQDMGPWTGRWLVNDVTRSLFKSTGTITLKKPLPALPEPDSTNLSTATASGSNSKWSIGGKGTSGGPVGEAIVAIAKKAMAAPGASTSYLFGGPPGIGPGTHTDCSGFVLAVYAKAGITTLPNGKPFPRTSQLQWSDAPMHPSLSTLQPGDLVFFDYEGPHSHVGIYIGPNPSGTNGVYIGDQHTGSGITEQPIDIAHFDGAARYTRKGSN